MAQTQVLQRAENDQILTGLRKKITVGSKDSLEVA